MLYFYAVQQALERFSALTLENHLHTCVTTAIRSEDNQEQEKRVIHEIMDVFKRLANLALDNMFHCQF